jgi:hypothetical protein
MESARNLVNLRDVANPNPLMIKHAEDILKINISSALKQMNRSVQAYISESALLTSLLSLSDATRPASRAEKIAETVALLREDPAEMIRYGINHVTESVLASCAHRLGLARFFSTSREHTH